MSNLVVVEELATTVVVPELASTVSVEEVGTTVVVQEVGPADIVEIVAVGPQGASGTLVVGSVTTGAAGSSVSITNVGTSTDAVLNIRIPRGDTGDLTPQLVQAKEDAEAAAVASEASRVASGNSASSANTSAVLAAGSASNAATSASAAANSASSIFGAEDVAVAKAAEAVISATNAATSASTASTKASEASTSATNAANSATAAASSATAAASSATAASGSATTATTKASEATTQANNSLSSANDAAQSALDADASATSATNSASTATTKAAEASTSATNAAASSLAATNKVTEALASATNAASSATAASGSALSASASASTATSKASEASTSATNAAASAATATTKASEASTSATNAATSATGAVTSATFAAGSASAASASATSASTSAGTATTQAGIATTKASEAATSASNAATSASTATTKASEATIAASSASTFATTATTKASEALTSAGNASTSASQAATSATNAATSATAADASEAAAATSETNAAASASSAATDAATATTKASQATTSASSASTFATTATTKASEASTSATNAAGSATSAANSATTATTQASNASTSATAAQTAATTSTTKAAEAVTSATNAASSASTASTQATAASGSATAAADSASTASTQATTATTKASEAATSATNAAGSATTATTKASEAATSATAAAAAKIAAETARDQTLSAFDSFDDRYLGQKASDPTVDNDGNALVAGAIYFNTGAIGSGGGMKVYDGSAWLVAYASLAGTLLKANNLSDLNDTAVARTNLGLGNVENKSSATIRGEITSGNVTTALGFTPYNAASLSGALAPYLTSASAASTYQPIGSYLTGINSSQVTTALGFTPANKAGDTFTGAVLTSNSGGFTANSAAKLWTDSNRGRLDLYEGSAQTKSLRVMNANGYGIIGMISAENLELWTNGTARVTISGSNGNATFTGRINSVGYSASWGGTDGTTTGALNAVMGTNTSASWLVSGTSGGVFRGGIQVLDGGGQLRIYEGTNYLSLVGGAGTINGNAILTSANYSSYSPTLTGTGASGSWGISVTGSAGSVAWTGVTGKPTTLAGYGITDAASSSHTHSYLPLSGGTLTGSYEVLTVLDNASIADGSWRGRIVSKNVTSNAAVFLANYQGKAGVFAHSAALDAWADLYLNTSDGSGGGAVRMGPSAYVANNLVLHAGNYTSYAATVGHNHTYDVNNAWLREANDDANVKLYGNTRQMVFRTDGTTEFASGVGPYAFAWMYGGDAASNRRMLLTDAGRLWTNTHGWMDEAFAPLSHVHSYLPLSGGTVLGRVTFQDSSDTQITLNGNGTNWTGITATDAGGTDYLWIYGATGTWSFGGGGSVVSGKKMHIHGGVTIGSGYTATSNPTNGLNVEGAIQQAGNQVLHAGNINSYIPNWSYGVTASHIVQRDPNGYIYANHVNFSTSESENATINSFITSNGDGWSRKASLAHVKNSIRGIADGTWGINITGSAGSVAGDTNIRVKLLTFTGEGGDSGNGSVANSYGIYQQGGSWTYPYPDLCIGFHTGIKIGAHWTYGGTRFYNNSDWATQIFSIGEGDNNIRAAETIYAAHYRGNANVGGTGEASHHPAGIYSNGTNWLYGTIYLNSNHIYDCAGINGGTPIHSGNYTSYSPSLSGNYKNIGVGGLYSRYNYNESAWITDATAASTLSPDYGTTTVAMHNSHGSFSNWATTLTMSGYERYGAYQISGNYNVSTSELAVRNYTQNTSTWTSWIRLLSSANYSSYALPLSGGTVSGSVTVSESYTNGWFRNNNSNQGLYNQSTGGHFCSLASNAWQITGNGSGIELQFRANHNSTIRGYVYGDTSNNFGLLNSTGNWAVQAYAGGGGFLHSTWSGTNIRANRANGNFYIDDNYGCGIVGTYASTRYQGVFFMGDSYKMAGDGTSLANMYGIGWSHPNAGGAAGNLTDHGMLIINNGGFRCAISNSIVASGNVTAYSDERLKTNWRDMPEDYVSRLAQVKVGIYDRIDEEELMTQVGVSAQSFQKLLPQAIMTAKDEMQTLSVSYGNAALASAVELAKDNVDLRAQLKAQELRIAKLESLINQLIGD